MLPCLLAEYLKCLVFVDKTFLQHSSITTQFCRWRTTFKVAVFTLMRASLEEVTAYTAILSCGTFGRVDTLTLYRF